MSYGKSALAYNKTVSFIFFLTFSFSNSAAKSTAGGNVIPLISQSPSIILSSSIIFTLNIEEIVLATVTESPPQGYTLRYLTATVSQMHKGTLAEKKGDSFNTMILTYEGPVRSRPTGLWVNSLLEKNQKWIITCDTKEARPEASNLLNGKAPGCQAFSYDEYAEDFNLSFTIASKNLGLEAAIKEAIAKNKSLTSLSYEFFVNYFEKEIEKHKSFKTKATKIWKIPTL